MANDVGRPLKLNRERVEMAQLYYAEKLNSKEPPFVEELAVHILDVDRHTVARWATRGENRDWLKKQPRPKARLFTEFCAIIKKCATLQLLCYKRTGFADQHNAVAIFLMKADHGMVETSRHELGGVGGGPIEFKPIEVLSTKGRKPQEAKK